MKLHKLIDWRLALFFGLVGLFIGVVFLLIIVIVLFQEVSGLSKDLPLLIFFAYVVGSFPALLTGAIFPVVYTFSKVGRRFPLSTYMICAAVTGGLLSWVCGKVTYSEASGVILALTGAFSAAICAVIAAKLGVGQPFVQTSPRTKPISD